MKDWVKALVEDAEPYAVSNPGDLYNAPPVEFLIEGILPLYSVVGLTGFPGTGKTWLAMEAARAVATGDKFLGKFPVKRAPVLFVGNDASFLDYAQQWRRLTIEEYADYEQSIIDGDRNTNPFDMHVHFLLQSDFNLDDTTQIGRIIRTSHEVLGDPDYAVVKDDEGNETMVEVTQRNFGLIVLDTLSKMTRTNEISNTDRDVVMEHIRVIAEATGATVLVLHHNTMPGEFRTGEEWRGGGAQFASLDAHFHLTAKNKALIEFKTKKMRGLTPPTFFFDLNVHEPGGASLDYNDLQPDAPAAGELIVEELIGVLKRRENAPTTKQEFANELWSKHGAEYADFKAFQRFVTNTLTAYTRAPNAKIVLAVRGSGGRASQYKLSYQEATGASGTSDEVGNGRTQESGAEAPGVAGESAETGGDCS